MSNWNLINSQKFEKLRELQPHCKNLVLPNLYFGICHWVLLTDVEFRPVSSAPDPKLKFDGLFAEQKLIMPGSMKWLYRLQSLVRCWNMPGLTSGSPDFMECRVGFGPDVWKKWLYGRCQLNQTIDMHRPSHTYYFGRCVCIAMKRESEGCGTVAAYPQPWSSRKQAIFAGPETMEQSVPPAWTAYRSRTTATSLSHSFWVSSALNIKQGRGIHDNIKSIALC